MSEAEQVAVLIVEDQTVVREGLRQLLAAEPGFVVAGEAATVAEAVAAAARHTPDVVLLDLKLPDGSGLDVCKQILRLPGAPAVLILSTFADAALVQAALDAGAAGYLPKTASFAEIASAIRAAFAGGLVLHPSLARQVVAKRPAELLDAEREMLRRLAAGESYQAIGEALFMSERTVRRHMNVIFEKLGVPNRAAAVAEALRRGLLD